MNNYSQRNNDVAFCHWLSIGQLVVIIVLKLWDEIFSHFRLKFTNLKSDEHELSKLEHIWSCLFYHDTFPQKCSLKFSQKLQKCQKAFKKTSITVFEVLNTSKFLSKILKCLKIRTCRVEFSTSIKFIHSTHHELLFFPSALYFREEFFMVFIE